jgi:hypothetical protein
MEVEEKADAGDAGGSTIKTKDATVVLQRVNLTQLRAYVQGLEFGTYNITVVSLKVTNDDKLRGFMRVDLSVSAAVPQGGELAGGLPPGGGG